MAVFHAKQRDEQKSVTGHAKIPRLQHYFDKIAQMVTKKPDERGLAPLLRSAAL